MWKRLRSRIGRYLAPFGAIIVTVLLHFALSRVVPKRVDFPYPFFYMIAISGVAWFSGYMPGAMACLITMVGLPFLAKPGFHLSNLDPSRLILVMSVSLLISKVSRVQQRMQEVLRDANDELDKRVQTKTKDLAHAVEALESEVAQRRQTEEKLQTQLERLNLLDQITRLIGERQDLRSVFQVVIRTLEDSLPVDFGCVCLYDTVAPELTVTCVGVRSEALAMELALTEQSPIAIDRNGLSR